MKLGEIFVVVVVVGWAGDWVEGNEKEKEEATCCLLINFSSLFALLVNLIML
jgi:hypothetical protein